MKISSRQESEVRPIMGAGTKANQIDPNKFIFVLFPVASAPDRCSAKGEAAAEKSPIPNIPLRIIKAWHTI